jgi:ABC-type transport system substrate-binding protein
VLDPRLTNSVGLSQIATLVYNRLLRYPFADEAKNNADLTLKGDLAESWEGSADFKTWTFQAPPGREMAQCATAQGA